MVNKRGTTSRLERSQKRLKFSIDEKNQSQLVAQDSNQISDIDNNQAIDWQEQADDNFSFQIKQKDKIEKKVELIFKDNHQLNNSLTIWGDGLDVEKTIGVVEELKRIYIKQGKSYKQETTIKTNDNNEPHLQVILTLIDQEDEG